MKPYVVRNASGVIVSKGWAPESQVPYQAGLGETASVEDHPPEVLVPAPPLSWDEQRRQAYPPFGEFLDAWVKNDAAALEDFRQKCLDVKAKIPKP